MRKWKFRVKGLGASSIKGLNRVTQRIRIQNGGAAPTMKSYSETGSPP